MNQGSAGVDVASDSPAKRAHRRQQSRYRDQVLGLPPGPPTDSRARKKYRVLGNYLPEAWHGQTAEAAGWNLMSSAALEYARHRLPRIQESGGVAEPERLWRNMLSSQPLAFSIVGEFRAHPEAGLKVLSTLADREFVSYDGLGNPARDLFALDGLQAEWAPPRDFHTGDRSGFDVAAALRDDEGHRLILSVEVKYVDTFSPKKLDFDRYSSQLAAVGLDRAATEQLVRSGASQFLRSILLTKSVELHGLRGDNRSDRSIAVVFARDDDRSARRVVELAKESCDPRMLKVELWTHELLLSAAANVPELADWSQRMQTRYIIDT